MSSFWTKNAQKSMILGHFGPKMIVFGLQKEFSFPDRNFLFRPKMRFLDHFWFENAGFLDFKIDAKSMMLGFWDFDDFLSSILDYFWPIFGCF